MTLSVQAMPDRLIAKTGGVIPLSLFKGDADGKERTDKRNPAKEIRDLILVVKRKADFIRMKNSSSFNIKQNSLSSRSATMPILTANRDNNICPLLGHFP